MERIRSIADIFALRFWVKFVCKLVLTQIWQIKFKLIIEFRIGNRKNKPMDQYLRRQINTKLIEWRAH